MPFVIFILLPCLLASIIFLFTHRPRNQFPIETRGSRDVPRMKTQPRLKQAIRRPRRRVS